VQGCKNVITLDECMQRWSTGCQLLHMYVQLYWYRLSDEQTFSGWAVAKFPDSIADFQLFIF